MSLWTLSKSSVNISMMPVCSKRWVLFSLDKVECRYGYRANPVFNTCSLPVQRNRLFPPSERYTHTVLDIDYTER